ncbi:hypothetical protein CONCODRAFT_78731 [Conidiobolus coronatus NRRL 28638]|uniref:F-box domain-containing protein n=1 Tax=Conidiobolus coronatus (strain ATCC 28846 / CBS 209.66 / NRRL 28638) TaxID=796925 RepID=A0A137P6M9_CONC2|nr:hypothetical protein CONCODRAFT_78731 [Conidiobolus coronatus NRRL 28638]|eukprot:KXN70662.1 hypothetical protein CONCODRAFT_78731 [Conidiobolus coronatus NRRL 28638]
MDESSTTLRYDGIPSFVEDNFDEDSVDNEYNHDMDCDDPDCEGCIEDLFVPSDEKMDREVKKMIQKLSTTDRNIKRIIISESSGVIPYQYHINIAILSYYTNINYLYLEFTNNPLEELNDCFEKLHCLETLIMRYAGIITWDDPQKVIDLRMPQSIKELKINTGQNYENPPSIEEAMDDNEAWTNPEIHFTIVPQTLPNLKKLVYVHDTANIASVIQEFIQLNPQLEFVGSNSTSFNARTMQIIEHIPGLEHEIMSDISS